MPVGEFDLKERTVNAAVKALSNLGTYDLDSNNCQHFVQKLLAKLHIQMPKDLITSQSLVTELGLGLTLYGAGGSSALM